MVTAHPLRSEAAWREAVLALYDEAAYREERYAAIRLTGYRHYRLHQHPGALDLYQHLVTTGAWRDLIDTITGNRVGPILRAFLTKSRLWISSGRSTQMHRGSSIGRVEPNARSPSVVTPGRAGASSG